MVFHWSLSESKSPQVSGTLLSIPTDLNNVVLWIVSTRPLISMSFNCCTNPLVIVASAPITISVTVNLMFHSFFRFSSKVQILTSLFAYFLLPFDHTEPRSQLFDRLFIYFTIISSDGLAEIRWPASISKSKRILYGLFSQTDFVLFIYHLLVWSYLSFLRNSRWITLPTQSCLVLYYLCTNLQHSLIWLIVSTLFPHNLYLLFCCILSLLALSLWRCFVPLAERIQFFSEGFPFLAMSKFSRVRSRLFVAWNIHTVVFLPIFVFWSFLFCWCLFCMVLVPLFNGI